MATKWMIRIDIIDINNKYTKDSLIEDVMNKWLPPSFDITMTDLTVERGDGDGTGKMETRG